MPRLELIACPLLVAATLATLPAQAECKDCGVVAEVKTIGKDNANDASTTAAVKAGANHQVIVKLDNGKTRHFTFIKPPDYRVGDKVKIVQGMKLEKR